MDPELNATIDRLVRTCECAIRRGTAPTPATLHTFQQQLVDARDTPNRAQTVDTLQMAIQYYRETVSAEVQTTALAELTDQVDTLAATLTQVDDEHRAPAETDDD